MSEEKKKVRKIVTPKFRVSFPHVFKPHSGFENQEPKYSVQMLFPKDTDISEIKKLAKEAAVKKWGNELPKNMRKPWRDGDEKNLDNYKNMIFINATSKMKPGVVDGRNGNEEILDPGEFYAGCWARATVTAYAYDTMGNKGVSIGLQNLQKVADDEAFGGRSNAKDDFEPLESDFDSGDNEVSDDDF